MSATESTALKPAPGAPPIVYDVTEEAIAEAATRCALLTCATSEGYEDTRIAIGKLRSTRTAIEARRKDLKAGALDYGRRVDARAKELTARIEAIETPLQNMKDAADALKAEEKRQREEAALIAREAELKIEREAEEARLKAAREEEERRIAADAERLAAERATFAEAQRKADEERAAEQARLDAQRAEIEAASRAVREREEAAAREERVRQQEAARIEADRLDAIQAERDAADATARAAEEAARLEALRPDVERVRAWGKAISEFAAAAPELESKYGAEAIAWGLDRLRKVAAALETFTPRAR